jgi:hypothetical protein
MSIISKAYEIQDALDDLDLTGHNLFDVLHYLDKFSHLYNIEWATRASRVIENYDARRIRVWYRDEDQMVIAVMHG